MTRAAAHSPTPAAALLHELYHGRRPNSTTGGRHLAFAADGRWIIIGVDDQVLAGPFDLLRDVEDWLDAQP